MDIYEFRRGRLSGYRNRTVGRLWSCSSNAGAQRRSESSFVGRWDIILDVSSSSMLNCLACFHSLDHHDLLPLQCMRECCLSPEHFPQMCTSQCRHLRLMLEDFFMASSSPLFVDVGNYFWTFLYRSCSDILMDHIQGTFKVFYHWFNFLLEDLLLVFLGFCCFSLFLLFSHNVIPTRYSHNCFKFAFHFQGFCWGEVLVFSHCFLRILG